MNLWCAWVSLCAWIDRSDNNASGMHRSSAWNGPNCHDVMYAAYHSL
jgi:hypothetical protein